MASRLTAMTSLSDAKTDPKVVQMDTPSNVGSHDA
jgi:hypothetical protein